MGFLGGRDMFIDKAAFKRLIKTNYKGLGLRIAKSDEGMISISGSGWIVEVDEECITKEIKGSLIELVGDFPKRGQVITYKPNESEKEELEEDNMMLWKRCEEEGESAHETRALIRTGRGLMEVWQQDNDFQPFLVKQSHSSIVSTRKMDADEEPPIGPVKNGNMLIWRNNQMAIGIFIEALYYAGERDTLAIMDKKDMNWKEIGSNAI